MDVFKYTEPKPRRTTLFEGHHPLCKIYENFIFNIFLNMVNVNQNFAAWPIFNALGKINKLPRIS